jgi:hypothetical protein
MDNIILQHCPTGAMLADFFTKPLQGNLFRHFRDILMGYQHISTLLKLDPQAASSEERVGNDENYELNSVSWESSTSGSTGTGSTTTNNNETNYDVHTVQNDKGTGTSTNEGTWSLVVNKKDKKSILRTANRNTKCRNKFAKLNTTLQTIRSI